MAIDPHLHEAAAAAWPHIEVSREELDGYASQVGADVAALGPDGLAEVYLACACSRGDAAALAMFEARYLDVVPAALAHMRLAPEMVDEVRQQVRHKLLVPSEPGGRPKIDEYAGQGKLRSLVQVVAVRAALTMIRKHKREARAPDHDFDALPNPDYDPELAYMKQRYRAVFSRAFEGAVRGLSSRDRNLLRLHLFGGLTVEQVGEIYNVHRATATRWLAKARKQLFSDTRRAMRQELDIDTDELDSLMGLIHSRFDVSVQRMLQTLDGSGPESDRQPAPDSED